MRNHILVRFASAAALTFAAGASTYAQTSTTTEPETVVLEEFEVIGSFRGSLAAAAEAKQKQTTIVEVLAAEDIGKLPDVSIADSLTRLTGVAAQRTNGRSQQINIRGLSGDFSTGMLNGREQVSTSLNRAVEYDQYPAELLGEVVVYKTAGANLTNQGLAGTVDLRTVRPLSKTGRVMGINAYYDWTQLGKLTPGADDKGEHGSFHYIDQFADGKFGFALGLSHSSIPFEGQQYQAWGFDNVGGNYLLGGAKPYVRTSNLDRDGVMAVFEFKPNDNIHSVVDVFYSDFQERQLLRGIEIPLAPNWTSWTGNGTVLEPGATVTDGLYTRAVISNVQPVVRNDTFVRDANPFAIGWNLKIGENSAWPIEFDAGYSRVRRSDQNLETWAGRGFAVGATSPDTMVVEIVPGRIPVITPTIDYANPSGFFVTDPQGWQTWMSGTSVAGPGWLKFLKAKDELGQFKLSTSHELDGFFSNLDIGVSYTDRYKKEGENPTGLILNRNGQTTAPLPEIIGTTDFSYLGIGDIFAYDPQALLENGLTFRPAITADYVAKRYEVREKITQLYAQFDLNGKLGNVPMTGNIGLRAIHADQFSKGFSVDSTQDLTSVSGGDKYWDLAPNLNLNFEVAEQTYVRFSVARQIARPRMYDLRAGRNWGYDPSRASQTNINQSPWSASDSGDPKLRPWKSNSIDLSFEKYFTEQRGYFSLALFHKDLRNFIYYQSMLQDFTGYPVRSGTPPALSEGFGNVATNGEGGSIKGAEVTLSLASEMLNEDIKGFGLILGGAYTDSSIRPWGPTGADQPIAGLSKRVANITLYYERGGFSARLSERYRSENRQYITTFGPPARGSDASNDGSFTVAQPETILDAQISYTMQSENIRGLTFYLQAYNLANEPLVTYENNDPRRVRNFQKYGASYSAGVSYKF